MTPQQFYAETLNKVIDYDGAYGAQCVDAFRYWGKMNNVPIPPTPNNWADGFWYSRDALGFGKWFVYVTDGNYRTGDWIFWARGSKSHPSSHVAMWFYGQEYGENQGGTGGTIYIPKALYDHLGDGTSLDYKAATNWATLDGYGTVTWAAIEGSPYESASWIEGVEGD